MQPPPIPSRKTAPPEKKGGSFWTVMFMTFLILWLFQILNRKPEPPLVPLENEPTVSEIDSDSVIDSNEIENLPDEIIEAAQKKQDSQFISLGSMDPKSPYRMLITLTNRGAAVARIELNEFDYKDSQDKTGYLGQIVVDESLVEQESSREYPGSSIKLGEKVYEKGLPGIGVQVVGQGTPAQKAGLNVGDRIIAVERSKQPTVWIDSFASLRNELLQTSPNESIVFKVIRKNEFEKAMDAFLSSVEKTTTDSDTESSSAIVSEISVASDSQKLAESTNSSESQASDLSNNKTESQNEPLATNNNQIDWSTLPLESVEVELGRAPINIVRPEGIIRNYNDYTNLNGLQGAVYNDDQGVYELLADYDDSERKHNCDPLSFLMTLGSYDGNEQLDWTPSTAKKSSNIDLPRNKDLQKELKNVDLRSGFWEYIPDQSNESQAVFRKILLRRKLEVRKIYSLVAAKDFDPEKKKGKNNPEYHLSLKIVLKNLDPDNKHQVSYLLDGPTGLPIEGGWYSAGRKTGPGWGSYGLRDLVLQMKGKTPLVLKCWNIANDQSEASEQVNLDYIGVDTQYFQCTFLPIKKDEKEVWHDSYIPIRVGAKTKDHPTFTNVSFRLKSLEKELAPAGQVGDSLVHEYQIYSGPKVPKILDHYGLEDTIVYGWFWFVAKPLLWILHFFHNYLLFNYGLAIILLTILVRLLMFPLSMKQVVSSLKMQKIQPELAALKKRYEGKPQEMMQAQQALFKKNGVNPLSGCLPIFIQLPIFIGLYKALSLDVNLYGVPLFSDSVRWCSNLAAPDMLWDWSGFWNSIGWPGFNFSGQSFMAMFCLGPYFNLLPLLTIALFLLQQKFLMPPVVGDDEAAQQQRMMRRMMTFMMIFMGFMFFKVPSGLCIYFIVSSLWGIIERQFHPKLDATPVSNDVIDIPSRPVLQTSAAVSSTGKVGSVSSTSGSPKPAGKHSKNRRGKGNLVQEGQKKGKIRAWWDNLVEKAKEQQKLAKAEMERQKKKQEKYQKRWK